MRESPDWIVLSMMANDGFCRARDDHLNFSSKLRVLSDTLMNGECGIGAEVAISKRTIRLGAALLPIMAAASYDQRDQHSRSGIAMDYADEQHGGVAEEMPPKIKAEENPGICWRRSMACLSYRIAS